MKTLLFYAMVLIIPSFSVAENIQIQFNPYTLKLTQENVLADVARRVLTACSQRDKCVFIFDIDDTAIFNFTQYTREAESNAEIDHPHLKWTTPIEVNKRSPNIFIKEQHGEEAIKIAIQPVLEFYKSLKMAGIKIIFITARLESTRNVTQAELKATGFGDVDHKDLFFTNRSSKKPERDRLFKEFSDSHLRVIGSIGDTDEDMLDINTDHEIFNINIRWNWQDSKPQTIPQATKTQTISNGQEVTVLCDNKRRQFYYDESSSLSHRIRHQKNASRRIKH